jgi:uncharacterized protein YeeX (DUF496 family)
MKNDNLDELFEDLRGKFDIDEPAIGHKNRFLDKLSTSDVASINNRKVINLNWKPFIAIAASVIICLGVFTTINAQPEVLDLASVSPQMAETQDFFTTTINAELKKLNNERSPLTEQVITDALNRIELLENDYQQLKTDLTESNQDQRVIYAMINNFQNRIDVLNTVLEQIKIIKELKTNSDEPKNTI